MAVMGNKNDNETYENHKNKLERVYRVLNSGVT